MRFTPRTWWAIAFRSCAICLDPLTAEDGAVIVTVRNVPKFHVCSACFDDAPPPRLELLELRISGMLRLDPEARASGRVT